MLFPVVYPFHLGFRALFLDYHVVLPRIFFMSLHKLANEKAQLDEELAAKPADPSAIPGIHMAEERTNSLR